MKTLYEVKQKIANELGFSDWLQMQRIDPESCLEKVDEVAKIYANAKLDEAAEKATTIHYKQSNGNINSAVNKESILSLKDKI